ncbi:hypothetical protein DY000_02046648 [Brassica cretica]|uniref:Uncharacterized protein n=1 Tax=Brassica cretica TaxID=69181 RepID=A0ABQ7EQ72_BRACR|nr:hypothetical protein DY000_02046648 [Brassica cretica]
MLQSHHLKSPSLDKDIYITLSAEEASAGDNDLQWAVGKTEEDRVQLAVFEKQVDVETVVEVAVVVMEMAVVDMNEVYSRRRWMWRPLAVVAMNEAQSGGSGGGGYNR